MVHQGRTKIAQGSEVHDMDPQGVVLEVGALYVERKKAARKGIRRVYVIRALTVRAVARLDFASYGLGTGTGITPGAGDSGGVL